MATVASRKTSVNTSKPSTPKMPDTSKPAGVYDYRTPQPVQQVQQVMQPQYSAPQVGYTPPSIDYAAMQAQQAELLRQAAEKRKQSELASRRQQYEAVGGRLTQEASAAPKRTYGTVQGVQTAQDQQSRSFSDVLAARGLASSGATAQGEIARNVTAQTGIGNALNLEAETLADIDRRRSEAEGAYRADVTSIESGIEADTFNRLADLQQRYSEMDAEQKYKNSLMQYEQGKEDKAQERSDYLSTIGRYGQDYTAELNKLKAQGVSDNDYRVMALQSARNEKLQSMEQSKAKVAQLQNEQQAELYDRALKRAEAFGAVQPQDAAILGIPAGTKTQKAEIQDLQAQLAQARYNLSASKKGGSRSGGGGSGSNVAYVPSSQKGSAEVALNVLNALYSKGDLVGAQTFIANNRAEIDSIASGRKGTVADQQAADEIQRKYYGLLS